MIASSATAKQNYDKNHKPHQGIWQKGNNIYFLWHHHPDTETSQYWHLGEAWKLYDMMYASLFPNLFLFIKKLPSSFVIKKRRASTYLFSLPTFTFHFLHPIILLFSCATANNHQTTTTTRLKLLSILVGVLVVGKSSIYFFKKNVSASVWLGQGS